MASPTPASAASHMAPAALSTPAKAAASPAPVVSGAGGNPTMTTTPSTAGGGSPSKRPGGQKHSFGVLHTGYLEKMNPSRGVLDKPKKRFVVLTHEGLHWFRREERYDLFGEERGSISVQDICKVELVKVGAGGEREGASNSRARASVGAGAHLDAFEVSCKQDVVRRVFRAASPEEAQAWVGAVKAAIKARFLYRRETLQGISLLPHGAHDAAHEEPPLVSVVTLRRAGEKHELVLAKAPHYKYGHLFELPYLALPAPSPSPSPSPRTPRADAGDAGADGGDVLCVLLSNGDAAEVPVRVLADAAGGATVAKVASLAGHAAHLPLTVEACRPQEGPGAAGAGAERGGKMKKGRVAMPPTLMLDTAVYALAAMIVFSNGGSTLTLTNDRVGLLVLVGLLRVVLGVAFAAGKGKQQQAGTAAAASAGRWMVLKVSVDDYVHDARGRGESTGLGAEEDALPPIPQRFIDGCLGDMVEAERRWRITAEWRRQYGTDSILEQEHPFYDLIKECYPSYYCSTGKDGNPVYYERSGQVDQPRLKAAGCGTDELVWHYIYVTEFIWGKVHPRETAKTITVFDVEGVGIRDLAGDAFDFLRKSSSLIQEHYPERSAVIMIVNAPSWFSFLWKMIKPMVNERTQRKVKIVAGGRETFEAIAEFVDVEHIPVAYGGQLRYGDGGPDSCRWHSPEEVALREHVYAVNKRCAEARAAAGVLPAPPAGMAAGGKHQHH